MNPVTQSLQSQIKTLAAESRSLMLRIIALKWGSLENAKHVGEIKAVREPGGAPIRRAEVKKLRHPETGPERAALWADKREVKDKTRHHLLAYAFVRGRSYASQEPKCKSAPSRSWIAGIIQEAGGQVPTDEALQTWIEPKVEAGASAPAAA
jgi:hypothetical protein